MVWGDYEIWATSSATDPSLLMSAVTFASTHCVMNIFIKIYGYIMIYNVYNMNICKQIYGYIMVYIHKDLLWWCLHSYLLMLIFEYSNFFFASFTLQTFQDVASNFLKECISIKGQFCSFMSQNRFRKVTACWIHIYSKGAWKKDFQDFRV